ARAHASPSRAGDQSRRSTSHVPSLAPRKPRWNIAGRAITKLAIVRLGIALRMKKRVDNSYAGPPDGLGAIRADLFRLPPRPEFWFEAFVISAAFLAICRQVFAVSIRYRLIGLRRGASTVALAIKANNPRLAACAVPDSCQTCEGKCGQQIDLCPWPF